MDPSNFDRVVAFMRVNWDLITEDESQYKPAYVARIADMVAKADAGEVAWSEVLRMRSGVVSHLLGWRTADHLRGVAEKHGGAVADGVRELVASEDADAFWRPALAAVGGEGGMATYPQLRGVGARAAVASFFLFVHDPGRWPMFRPRNYGVALVKITGEPLDRSTPGTLLRDYYRSLDGLLARFNAADLPAASRLDVQGVLWVATYKGVV